jgi:Tol biopolymer transport system component
VTEYKGATWFPGGTRLLLVGREAGKSFRCYIQDVDGGEPRAVTPEGRYAHGSAISPDGNWFFAYDDQNTVALYPVDGGEPRPVAGLGPMEYPFRWSADGRSLFIHVGEKLPVRIARLDLATQRKEMTHEITPRDAATGTVLTNLFLTPDGKSYVYTYRRALSDLSLIDDVS